MRSLWPTGGLWRHRDFLKLWSAETISQFGSQIDDLALPLVAILVLDASAFEVAVLGTVLFLPFILFTLPAGVWVDRLPRRPILIIGDFGRAALYATVPIAYVADVAHALAALRRRLPRRRLPRSSSTSPTSRTCPRSSIETRSSRATRSSRSAGRRRRSRARARRDPRRDPDGAVRHPRRRIQLPRVGPPHPPYPQAGGASRATRRSRRHEDELLAGRQGGPPLRARQPQPARPSRAAPRLELLLQRSASRSTSSSRCASSGSRRA